jgi:hypothetical protein
MAQDWQPSASAEPAAPQSAAARLAHAIGAPRTVIISGIACMIGSLWFWSRMTGIRSEMRPIYQRLGIVPGPEIAVQEAAEG